MTICGLQMHNIEKGAREMHKGHCFDKGKECDFISELNNTPCFKERKRRRLCSGLSAKWQKVVRPKIISISLWRLLYYKTSKRGL